MRNHSIFALAIIALLVVTTAEAKYSGGTGEPNNPYIIATAENMNEIGANPADWNKHFILINDVNLAQYTGTQFKIIGTSFNQPFQGVFDGNDHKVWNFTWTSTSRTFIGLFGCIGTGGKVKNLGMENVNVNAGSGYLVGGLAGSNDGTISDCNATGSVTGRYYVGGLVGWNCGGAILTCYATGEVSGDWYTAGGLVGVNDENGTILTCYSTGSVTGGDSSDYVGGLVGENYGTITNCYSTGSVSGYSHTGGLVGRNYENGTIENCYSTGSVTGNWLVGGLVGSNVGVISDCYATGSVSGYENIGGLVGWNYGGTILTCYATGSITGCYCVGGLVGENDGTITNCYSISKVTGEYEVGGLVGYNYLGTITNCYSTGSVSGYYHTGGLVGSNDYGKVLASSWDVNTSGQTTSDGGEGKTTAEMKTKSTFTDAGWDFVGETVNGPNDYWRMCVDDVNYPLLSWQFVPDFVCPDGVDILDLAFFVERWLAECDEANNFCNCTDINYDGSVNFLDFAILADHWLIDYSVTSPPAMPYRP